ncbi:MAG: MFS transporter [Senegalia sp. (in: firmicutes)]|uniref:MFS transporter n=1 Tax=Senegalia sp. (in: firmicutes) TaxID=1924098 RepID=UPI003F9B912A
MLNIFSQYKGLSRSAYVLFFARIITNMGGFIWPLLTLILSRKIGYSASTIAWLSVAIGGLFLPATIIGGKLADKFNRKKIIVIFDLITVVFFVLAGLVEPGTTMLVFFVIAGLFANMEYPAFEALIADVTKPKEREKVYSLSYLGHNLGFMFGASIGGLLFENYLNLAFIIDGFTTLLSTILIIIFIKNIKVDDTQEEENEYEVSTDVNISSWDILKQRKSILIQLIIFIFASFIYDQWSFVLPLYMEDIFLDKGAKYFGLISSFNGFVVIAFTPIITYLFRKLNELPKIIIGISLYPLSYLIIKDTNIYMVFYIMMFAFTIGEIVNMLGSAPYISRRVPASHRGRISSYRNIGYFIGGTVGRVVMGYLIDKFSYEAAFITLGIVGILASIVVGFNYKLDKSIFPKLYENNSNKL